MKKIVSFLEIMGKKSIASSAESQADVADLTSDGYQFNVLVTLMTVS